MDRPTKDKPRRNSEKRREKSRDAARQRRTQETNVFTELAKNLPLPESKSSQLDKASIMRLTLATLKQTQIRSLISDEKIDEKTEEEINELEQKTLALYPKALDGFLVIISKEGEIIFLSEQVVKFLGIQQIELLGQNIFEYTHPCDHDELRDMLSPKSHLFEHDPYRRSFSVRMKCTLTNKGRNINIKSASYKVIKFTGKLILPSESKKSQNENGNLITYLFAFGEQIPHPSNIEVPLGHKTFLSQHSMDMKFTIWDEKIKELVGYNSDDIIGRPIYDYYHALDGEVVGKAYKNLMGKGQIMTEQYRFLAKKGGHVWVVTQATIIYDPRSHKSQYVVCVHYVLSEIQNRDEILSIVQQAGSDDDDEDIKEEIPVVVLEDKDVVLESVRSPSEDSIPGPQLNTEKIFAPKTKDMEEDLFLQSSTAIPVNECLQDLTNRAPSAGDVCISLQIPPYGNDLQLASPSLDMVKLKDEPSEDKNVYLWDSNEFSFRRSPHVGLITPTSSDSEGQDFSKMTTSPPDYHQHCSLDEDIFLKFSMDTNLNFTGRNSVNMIQKDVFDKGKSLYDQDEWELKNVFPDYKIEPFCKNEMIFSIKSPESPKKSLSPDLPKNVQKSQLKQDGTQQTHAKRPIDISCLEKGPPEKHLKFDSSPQPFFGSFSEDSLNSITVEEPNKESVLRNLLVNGEDLNNGYSVNRPLTSPSFMTDLLYLNTKSMSPTSNRLLLPRLTQSDCDVNAPIPSNGLLHGNEILKALDDPSIII